LITIASVIRQGAKIAIVGDTPSKADMENKLLFSGSSGRVLDKALGFANIDRKQCSLTAVCKEPIFPFGIDGIRSPRLQQWMQMLKGELNSSRRPNVAVALGEEALYALTDKRGITKWRGSILPSTLVPGLKVIPALSPSWIMRGQFQHFWNLTGDLTRAERQSHFPEIRPPQYQSFTSPDLGSACNFINGIPSDAKWSLDIETRAHQLACFSIAYGDRAMCIPIQNPSGPAFFPTHEAKIWQTVRELMRRNPFLVGQNLTFDLEYLFDYGLEPSGIHMDTMLSHAILYPEFPKGLDFLAAMYTEMPYYKADGKVSNPKLTTQDLWTYNNKDTIATLWCALEIEKALRKRGLWSVHEFVTKEIGLALEMQRCRLRIDPVRKAELKALMSEAKEELDLKWTMPALAGESKRPNVNSPKQVSEFLYGHLKLPTKTRDGSVVSDETAITELKAQHPNVPELGWILEERHLRKLSSSYLDVELEPDGTWAGSWCPHGTETGRWSSGKGARGRGLNLQTVPKAVRWMVVPPERQAA
jgi:uracil-DNA glycosylase family 4